MRVYADDAALAEYPGGSGVPTDDTTVLLEIASKMVDALLVTRVYDTDDDGYPTDADYLTALQRATCAIVVELDSIGVTAAGGTQVWQNVRIGNVSLAGPGTADDTMTVMGFPVPNAALVQLADVGCTLVAS